MSNIKQEKDRTQPIRVFIRLRPLSKQEQEIRSSACVEISSARDLVIKHQYGKRYTFDKVFGSNAKQVDIYKNIVKPLIPEILAGYNCTVFAYGQTGTGKTYTMAGGSATTDVSWEGDEQTGIIPRAMAHLFDELTSIQQQYTVRVSYLELYNEELFDLLSDNLENRNIRLFEDQHQKGSVIINGILTETVCNKNQVYAILQKGQEKRRTTSTLLNDRSSRSHAVFTIIVHTCETTIDGEELVKTGKLNLVDLAGSENIGKFRAGDRRARETGSINQSLLTLGRVIKSLVEKSVHIPYRESKLTRILQDSLGGRTKTSIIATISPATSCLEETLSTLDYAHRAKCITNRPEINQRVSKKAWKAEYEKEMNRLRKDLHAARTGTGIYIDHDNYDRLISDNEICKEELSEKLVLITELEETLKQMEEEKVIKEMEWNKMQHSFHEMNNELDKCCTMLNHNEGQHPLCCEIKTESFQKQALHLLGLTEKTAKNFHKKIQSLLTINEGNNNSLKLVCEKVCTKCKDIVDRLIDFMINIKDTNEYVIDVLRVEQERQMQQCETSKSYGNNILWEARSIVNSTSQGLEDAIFCDWQEKEEFLKMIETKLKEVQNMTKWVDVKINLESTREELLIELNKTRENANKQRKATSKIMGELETIGKGMLEMQHSIKMMMDRVHDLENSVHNLTSINHECLRDINKVQVIVEQNLLGICNKIQNNMDCRSVLLIETIDSVNKSKKQDIAVTKVLNQLHKCKQNFPEINEQNETQLEHSMEVYTQNIVDITKARVKTANEMFTEYTTKNNDIQKHLMDLNKTASQNELIIHSALQNCQKSLTDFLKSGIIDIRSSDKIPIRLYPKVNNCTQTNFEDQTENSYSPTNRNENKLLAIDKINFAPQISSQPLVSCCIKNNSYIKEKEGQ